jgi:hypothetical protein
LEANCTTFDCKDIPLPSLCQPPKQSIKGFPSKGLEVGSTVKNQILLDVGLSKQYDWQKRRRNVFMSIVIIVESWKIQDNLKSPEASNLNISSGACLKTLKSQSLFFIEVDVLKQFNHVLGKLTGAINMSAGANQRIIL